MDDPKHLRAKLLCHRRCGELADGDGDICPAQTQTHQSTRRSPHLLPVAPDQVRSTGHEPAEPGDGGQTGMTDDDDQTLSPAVSGTQARRQVPHLLPEPQAPGGPGVQDPAPRVFRPNRCQRDQTDLIGSEQFLEAVKEHPREPFDASHPKGIDRKHQDAGCGPASHRYLDSSSSRTPPNCAS